MRRPLATEHKVSHPLPLSSVYPEIEQHVSWHCVLVVPGVVIFRSSTASDESLVTLHFLYKTYGSQWAKELEVIF